MYITVLGVRYPLGKLTTIKPDCCYSKLLPYAQGCHPIHQELLGCLDLGIAEQRIAAILGDNDIIDKHTATAAVLFSLPEWEVTAEQRAVGKQRNFLILYGANDL